METVPHTTQKPSMSPPVQFGMVLEETQNMPAGKDSLQPPVRENELTANIASHVIQTVAEPLLACSTTLFKCEVSP
jgi:hypothetical protein